MGVFSVQLNKNIEKAKVTLDTVVQKATFDLFKSVILKSPVDTGRFKGNWTASANSYGTATVEVLDKTGTTTINAMSQVALGTKSGGIVYLVNNLPYAYFLEYGGSQQAPAGMVRTSIAEYQSFIDRAAR